MTRKRRAPRRDSGRHRGYALAARTERSEADEDETTPTEPPSFEPLRAATRGQDGAGVGSTPDRKASRNAADVGRPIPARRGYARRALGNFLLAGAFAAGIMAGLAGTAVLGSYLYPGNLSGTPAEMTRTTRLGRSSAEGSTIAAAASEPAPSTPRESADLLALQQEFERQFAARRLDQPENENALESYKRMAAIAPDDLKVRELGQQLSGAFWLLAKRAETNGQRDDALRYFAIRKTLPAVSLATLYPTGEHQQGEDRPADAHAANPHGSPAAEPPSAAAASGPEASTQPHEPQAPEPSTESAAASAVVPPANEPATAGSEQGDPPQSVMSRGADPQAQSDVDVQSTFPAQTPGVTEPRSPTGDSEPPATPSAGATSLVTRPSAAIIEIDRAAGPANLPEAPDPGASSAAVIAREKPEASDSSGSNSAILTGEARSSIVAVAMARGDEAIAHGDVISARRFYEVAAANGLARAAIAVARTYDPIYLQSRAVRGPFADVNAAKRWYQMAIDGGDADARVPLDMLAKITEPNARH